MSLLRTSDVSETKLTFVAADINFFNADKDETALAVLACVAGVSDKSTRGDFVN